MEPSDPKSLRRELPVTEDSSRGPSSLISIVVPAFDEQDNLRALYDELCQELQALRWELVFVDDGSSDGTFAVISDLAASDERVRGVKLSRNFGHQPALMAGLREARGAAVVSMDADLQHPPAAVPELVRHWQNGASIVHTVRGSGEQNWFKRRTSAWYYRVFSLLSGVPIHEGESDFRLLDREVVAVVVEMEEARPFLRGLVHWVGYPQVVVPYQVRPRHSGRSHYGLLRMVGLAAAGITSFSTVPLRIGILLGVVTSIGAFVELGYVLWIEWRGETLPGWASVAGLLALLMGMNFILLGFLGTYIGQIFERVQGHPAFLVERRTGKQARAEPPHES